MIAVEWWGICGRRGEGDEPYGTEFAKEIKEFFGCYVVTDMYISFPSFSSLDSLVVLSWLGVAEEEDIPKMLHE